MKKISEQHRVTIRELVDTYDAQTLIAEIKQIVAKDGGRPPDPIFNVGIIWAHVEFLKLHRVTERKQKLERACELLEDYLGHYTAGTRLRTASTLAKIYKSARAAAIKDPFVGLVMKDTFTVLQSEIAASPQKVPVPYLIEGSAKGWKFPWFDTEQHEPDAEFFKHEGPDYTSGLTWIVTPKNI